MRIMIVNEDYWPFVEDFYERNPALRTASYAEQHRARMATFFGMADSYSHHLNALSCDAWDVILNIEPMQRQWARENGVSRDEFQWSVRWDRGFIPRPYRRRDPAWRQRILTEQVKAFRPDVLYSMAMESVGSEFLRSVRGYYRIAVGQHAAPLPEIDIREYDLVLSSLPNLVDYFRAQGLRSERFRLGFDTRILCALDAAQPDGGVAFVGGLSSYHARGTVVLEALCERAPVSVWGYGEDNLPTESAIRTAFKGGIWGLQMFETLRRSRIVFNRHIDVAARHANNMRLYEATGVGALLVTDHQDDIRELFEPDREVVTYRSIDECVERVMFYLENECARASIAAAGHARTMREHTYAHRMTELLEILQSVL